MGQMMAKINETLKTHGMQELSMEDMDQVFGGYTLDQLTEAERFYFEKLKDAFVDALLSRKESEMKEVKRLLAEFDEEMHKKYDL